LLLEHGLVAMPNSFDRQLLMQLEMSRLVGDLRTERAVRQVTLRLKVVDHESGERRLLNDLRMRETTGDPVFAHQTVFSLDAYNWTYESGDNPSGVALSQTATSTIPQSQNAQARNE